MDNKRIIGRLINVDLPEYSLKRVEAKVDTGAYRGTLHCESITLEKQGSRERLCFVPLDPRFKSYRGDKHYAGKYKKVRVRSSNGSRQTRYAITTKIVIDGIAHPIEISLSVRDRMSKPMLIGRRFLRAQRMVVDVSHKGGKS